jgi:hypothetical protein
MGRQDYSRIGRGMTQREARNNAIADAQEYSGDQEGYSGDMNCATDENPTKCLKEPKLAKTCTVQKNVQKGARKWETVFILCNGWHGGDSLTLRNVTQGAAVKEAKRLALRNQCSYSVSIEKRLSQGSNEIATISPKKSTLGEWLFSGMARC